jgi:hypothetical protein
MKKLILAALVALTSVVSVGTASAQSTPITVTYANGSTPVSTSGTDFLVTFNFTTATLSLSNGVETESEAISITDGTQIHETLSGSVESGGMQTITIMADGAAALSVTAVAGNALGGQAYAGPNALYRNATAGGSNVVVGSLTGNPYSFTVNQIGADRDNVNNNDVSFNATNPNLGQSFTQTGTVQASNESPGQSGSSSVQFFSSGISGVPEPSTWIASMFLLLVTGVSIILRPKASS